MYHNGLHISEAVRSNFFIIDQEDTIVTTDQDILFGITRKQLLQVAQNFYKIEVRPISLTELYTAKEAFLTSSTKGVLPVVQIDDLVIGGGKPGPITQHLGVLFNNHQAAYVDQTAAQKN